MADTAWNVPVDRELHNRLRRASFEDERSQAEIVREAVEQWLARREHAEEGGQSMSEYLNWHEVHDHPGVQAARQAYEAEPTARSWDQYVRAAEAARRHLAADIQELHEAAGGLEPGEDDHPAPFGHEGW
jgi:hypothetical protein